MPGLCLGAAFVAAGSALLLSRIDPRVDEPFCSVWATVALVGASVSAVGWARAERVTWLRVGIAYWTAAVPARVAGGVFGLS